MKSANGCNVGVVLKNRAYIPGLMRVHTSTPQYFYSVFISPARRNSPVSLILIPLLGILLWLPGFLSPSPPVVQVSMPLYLPIDIFLRAHPEFSVFLGLTFTLGEAFLLNFIIRRHQLLAQRTWLPALLFTVLASCTPGLLWLHPQLFAGFFLLLAVHLLLGTYRLDKAVSIVFTAGFLIGCAAQFYFPATVFLLFAVVVLMVMRPFIWREWVILILGAATPFVYAGVWFFWKGKLLSNTQKIITEPIVKRDFFFKFPVEYYALAAMIGMVLLVSMARFVSRSGTSTLKTKKGISVMICLLFFSAVAVIPAQNFAVAGFLFALYPLSFLISNYFLVARRTWLAEIIFLLLLAGIGISYAMNMKLF